MTSVTILGLGKIVKKNPFNGYSFGGGIEIKWHSNESASFS